VLYYADPIKSGDYKVTVKYVSKIELKINPPYEDKAPAEIIKVKFIVNKKDIANLRKTSNITVIGTAKEISFTGKVGLEIYIKLTDVEIVKRGR